MWFEYFLTNGVRGAEDLDINRLVTRTSGPVDMRKKRSLIDEDVIEIEENVYANASEGEGDLQSGENVQFNTFKPTPTIISKWIEPQTRTKWLTISINLHCRVRVSGFLMRGSQDGLALFLSANWSESFLDPLKIHRRLINLPPNHHDYLPSPFTQKLLGLKKL